MARRRRHIKFTEKNHSKKGMLSLGIAIAMIAVYILFLVMAYRNGGTLSVYYGSAGVFAVFVSLAALVLAIQSLGEENSFRLFPRAATLASLISLLVWGGTYALGFWI